MGEEILKRALQEACNLYQEQLYSNTEAMRYWREERGLSDEAIRHFRLGYAPRNNRFLMRELNETQGISLRNLHNAGLVNIHEDKPDPSNLETGKVTNDFFYNRVMIPFLSGRDVIGFVGRKWQNNQDGPKYLNSREIPSFRKREFLFNSSNAFGDALKEGVLYIFEAPISVISAYQQGISNVVGISGTALTNEHVELMKKKLPDAELILCLDSDEAGQRNLEKILEKHAGKGFKVCFLPQGIKGEIKSINCPEGERVILKDPDDFVRAGYRLKDVLSVVSGGMDYLLELKMRKMLKKIPTLNDAEDKLRLINEVRPALAGAPREKRMVYIECVAKTLRISTDSVMSAAFPSHIPDLVSRNGRHSKANLETVFMQMLVYSGMHKPTLDFFSPFFDSKSPKLFSPTARATFEYFRRGGSESVHGERDAPLFSWPDVDNEIRKIALEEKMAVDYDLVHDFLSEDRVPLMYKTTKRKIPLEALEEIVAGIVSTQFSNLIVDAHHDGTTSLEGALKLYKELRRNMHGSNK